MVAKPLLPQAFWFRFAFPCTRIEGIPRANASCGLLGLPAACALPDLKPLDGGCRVGRSSTWLECRAASESPSSPTGSTAQQLTERRPEGFAVAQFWVDTRDTRNVSRATRFCHRFVVRIDRGDSRGRLRRGGHPAPDRACRRRCADRPLR